MKKLILATSFLALLVFTAGLEAPLNLRAIPMSPTRIDINWHDVSNKETGFQIFQSRDGTNFINVASVPRNVQTYSATKLLNGTRYWFKVRAYRSGTASAFSNTVNAVTTNPVPPPSPTATPVPTPTPTPTATPSPSPTATPTPTPSPSATPTPTPPIQTRAVTVQISNPTAGDTYQIFYGTSANNYGPPVDIPAGSSSVDIPNLTVGTLYYFANKVNRGGVYSVMSDFISYTVTAATTQQLEMP